MDLGDALLNLAALYAALVLYFVLTKWRRKRNVHLRERYLRQLAVTQRANKRPPKLPNAGVAEMIAETRREAFYRKRKRRPE